MNQLRFFQLIFSLLISSALVAAPLFEDDTPLEIELTGPVRQLIEQRDPPQPIPFVLRESGHDHAITARARGKSRLRVCDFPPLRIEFQEPSAEGTPFAGQGKLKMVTHCRNRQSGDMNALEEYLAYRIFGMLSEAAYRVRAVQITYTDTRGGADQELRNRYGFFIEPTAQLAERLGGSEVNASGVALKQLDAGQAALVYVFQYLIGNTDWSLVTGDADTWCCFNGKLIKVGEKIHYVPYDFDLSGLVDASYAKPDPSLHIRSVRKRKYRGYCTDSQTLLNAIRAVNARKADMFHGVRDTPWLTDKARGKIESYLTRFFDKAEDESRLLRSFERQCIG